ncbi:MAG: GAP family protein [Chloroflexota bacterium]
MSGLLPALLPLIIGSAVVPIQLVITVLLLGGPGGRSVAAGWIAGMTTVRLAQGLLFGIVLGAAGVADDPGEASTVESVVLLVLALLFFLMAVKGWLKVPDEDAPPPAWMTRLEGVSSGRAFLLGAGVIALAVKSWVFTLGAIGAIEEAGVGGAAGVAWFVAFVVLAQILHLGLLGVAVALPDRADVVLGQFAGGLERHQRTIVIALGLIFGAWFLLKGLAGLGVL